MLIGENVAAFRVVTICEHPIRVPFPPLPFLPIFQMVIWLLTVGETETAANVPRLAQNNADSRQAIENQHRILQGPGTSFERNTHLIAERSPVLQQRPLQLR